MSIVNAHEESRTFERQRVSDAILKHGENLQEAATELGVTLDQLNRMIAEFEGNDALEEVTL